MAAYLDKGTVKFILLASLFAFLLQARPPQQEVDPFERPVGWFPGAARPSNRSTQGVPQPGVPSPPLVTSLGISCGDPAGTNFVTSDSRTFSSDLPYLSSNTTLGKIGDFSTKPGYTVQGAAEQGLYVRERFGDSVYTIPNLENGVYEITFYETEAWFTAPGERVFAVYIDDVLTPQSSVDLFLRAGGSNIAADFTLNHTVNSNQMVISFQSLVGDAKINAIWLHKIEDLPVASAPVPTPPTPALTEAPYVPLHYVSSLGINCGSASQEPYIDDDGRKFVNDEPYLVNGSRGVADFSGEDGFTIEGTQDQLLYVTERFGPVVYNMTNLESGVYWVTFYETEAWYNEPGKRIFSIAIDGLLTDQQNLDLFALNNRQRVVANKGVFHMVQTHSMLIEFVRVVDEPKINAIWVQKVRELKPSERLPSPTVAPVPVAPAPVPTVAPPVPTSAPSVPTTAPVVPTAAPVVPTMAPAVPTSAPVVPTMPPVVPTSAPVLPPPVPETSTAGKAPATEKNPVAGTPVFTPMPEGGQSSLPVPEWILKGLPISFYSTLACTAIVGPIAELFGYKTVVSIGAFARVLIQLVLLFNMPLAAAQIQYGIGAAADIILVAFLFLHVSERHFQLATSAALAASAIGVVGAAAISQLMQYFMPDVLIHWLPLGSTLLAAFLASLLPQDPVRDELDRSKGDRNTASRLPLRGFFGREGLVGEFFTVYKSAPIWILSFWWVFASAVNASLLNYAPDLLTEINPDFSFNRYALNIVHILSAAGALLAIKLAAPVARTGGLAYFVGSIIIGLAAVGGLLLESLGMAYTSLVLTAGIAQLLLCLVFAQSAALVSNGRFALLFGTNATLALLVQGGTQLAMDHMGWHIGAHFFVLGLASISGAILFGLMWALYRFTTGSIRLVNAEDSAGDYDLIGGKREDSRTNLPIYQIHDDSTWKADDEGDDEGEGDVEMLGLIEGRPNEGMVVKDEGPLTRL